MTIERPWRMACGPLYHIFALMGNFIAYFSIGAENWLVPNPRDMDAFVKVLEAARPTVITDANTIFAGIAAHPRAAEVDWSRLRLAGGGTAVIETTANRWKALTGTMIREGYGLSETTPSPVSAPRARTLSTARPACPCRRPTCA